MKKLRILTPIMSVVALSGATIALAGCSCKTSEKKVTSIVITNTTKSVTVGEQLKLTADVLPADASNKVLKWTVTKDTGDGEIVKNGDDSYLKGTHEGKVSVVAEATDGSGIKSAAVDFTVTAQVKSAKLNYTGFTEAGIVVTDEITEISSEGTEQQEIYMRLTPQSEVGGVIQVLNTDGTVLQEMEWKQYSAIEEVSIDFTNWSKVTSGSTLTVNFSRSGFNKKSWTAIATACNNFENSDQTEANAQELLKGLGVEYDTTKKGNTVQETLQNHLVGLEGTIIINTKAHTVRIIDAMHDKSVNEKGDEKTTALTFQLFTLLSQSSDGKAMKSKWDSVNCRDYTNSIFRANLTGQGTGTKSFGSTALSMLSSDIQANIKTVKKSVTTKTGGATTWTLNTYNDKLFPLTNTEMNNQYSDFTEGTKYKYWTNHTEKADRVIKDFAGTSPYGLYWMGSPTPNSEEDVCAWYMDNSGENATDSNVADEYGVTFGFCI